MLLWTSTKTQRTLRELVANTEELPCTDSSSPRRGSGQDRLDNRPMERLVRPNAPALFAIDLRTAQVQEPLWRVREN
jgi:hypothetical protein